jgi:hypothetical protein
LEARVSRDVGALPHLAEASGRGPVFLDSARGEVLRRSERPFTVTPSKHEVKLRLGAPGGGAGCYVLRPRLPPGKVTVAGVATVLDTYGFPSTNQRHGSSPPAGRRRVDRGRRHAAARRSRRLDSHRPDRRWGPPVAVVRGRESARVTGGSELCYGGTPAAGEHPEVGLTSGYEPATLKSRSERQYEFHGPVGKHRTRFGRPGQVRKRTNVSLETRASHVAP